MHRHDLRLLMVAAAIAIVLGAASPFGLAATNGAFDSSALLGASFSGARCGAPPLPGAVVNVTVTDMGGMMRGP